MVNLRRMVFAPDFEIMFTPETENQREIFSDFQFKKFFAEFLIIMEQQTNLLVEQIVNKYPIIDLVFVHIFRSLLAQREINEPFELRIQTELVFGEFAEPLGLNITSYGNCWKFEDSDMFCFEEDESRLYLAYIVEGGEVHTSVTEITGLENRKDGITAVSYTTLSAPVATTYVSSDFGVIGAPVATFQNPISIGLSNYGGPVIETTHVTTSNDAPITFGVDTYNLTSIQEPSNYVSSYTFDSSAPYKGYETTTTTIDYTSPVTTYETTSTPIATTTYTT